MEFGSLACLGCRMRTEGGESAQGHGNFAAFPQVLVLLTRHWHENRIADRNVTLWMMLNIHRDVLVEL